MNENVERMASRFVETIEGSGENSAEVIAEMLRLIRGLNEWRVKNGYEPC